MTRKARQPTRARRARTKPAPRTTPAPAGARVAPEEIDYVVWAAAASAAIRRAIGELKGFRSRRDVPPEQRAELTAKIADLEAELNRNDAEIETLVDEEHTFPAPSVDDVEAVTRLVKVLDVAITSATVAKAALGAATAILDAIAKARS